MAGWAFVLAGLAFMVEGVVWFAILPVFAVVMASVVIAPIVYSYLLARQKKNAKK